MLSTGRRGLRQLETIAAVVGLAGSAQATGTWLADLFKNEGQNVRSAMNINGCLDGAFDASDYTVWSGDLQYDSTCWYGACPYTTGYWETCNSEPWQKWTLSEGHLWTTSPCFGAHRCADAPSVTERDVTGVCALDCWGGAGQEFYADEMCMTYSETNAMVMMTRCGDYLNQLWFIPGTLPQ